MSSVATSLSLNRKYSQTSRFFASPNSWQASSKVFTLSMKMCIRDRFSIPAAAKNPELAKEFLRFLYSDESVSAFAEASGALYATKSAREVAKDKLSTAIYNMYGIYEEANASSLIMSFAAVPADCKINPKDEIFNPITSVMNDEMTVEEWAQNVEAAFAQVRADMEAAN